MASPGLCQGVCRPWWGRQTSGRSSECNHFSFLLKAASSGGSGTWCLLDASMWRPCKTLQLDRDSGRRPRTRSRDHISHVARKHLEVDQREPWRLCLAYHHHSLDLYGWMDVMFLQSLGRVIDNSCMLCYVLLSSCLRSPLPSSSLFPRLVLPLPPVRLPVYRLQPFHTAGLYHFACISSFEGIPPTPRPPCDVV